MEYKGFNIEGDGKFGMHVIENLGSGAIPTYLKGLFSTPKEAMKRIDSYKPKRGAIKRGETTTAAEL